MTVLDDLFNFVKRECPDYGFLERGVASAQYKSQSRVYTRIAALLTPDDGFLTLDEVCKGTDVSGGKIVKDYVFGRGPYSKIRAKDTTAIGFCDNDKITVYRGGSVIKPGDLVVLENSYADYMGKPIHSKTVSPTDIVWSRNVEKEWYYVPEKLQNRFFYPEDFWIAAQEGEIPKKQKKRPTRKEIVPPIPFSPRVIEIEKLPPKIKEDLEKAGEEKVKPAVIQKDLQIIVEMKYPNSYDAVQELLQFSRLIYQDKKITRLQINKDIISRGGLTVSEILFLLEKYSRNKPPSYLLSTLEDWSAIAIKGGKKLPRTETEKLMKEWAAFQKFVQPVMGELLPEWIEEPEESLSIEQGLCIHQKAEVHDQVFTIIANSMDVDPEKLYDPKTPSRLPEYDFEDCFDLSRKNPDAPFVVAGGRIVYSDLVKRLSSLPKDTIHITSVVPEGGFAGGI